MLIKSLSRFSEHIRLHLDHERWDRKGERGDVEGGLGTRVSTNGDGRAGGEIAWAELESHTYTLSSSHQ